MDADLFMFATVANFSYGVTSLVKLASQEIKGVTYFEIAPIVEVCCG
jgi:hypothetical protein